MERSILPIHAVSDELIFEEAARRLQAQYARDHGTAFLFGTFRFLFHEGQFQGVEDWPRFRRYASPGRARRLSQKSREDNDQ